MHIKDLIKHPARLSNISAIGGSGEGAYSRQPIIGFAAPVYHIFFLKLKKLKLIYGL